MPGPILDTPEALDAAIAASRDARRANLVRAVRNQRIRTRVAFGLSAGVAMCAFVAFLVTSDREAGAILGLLACMCLGWTYAAGKTGRTLAGDSLRKMDRSM